MDCFAEPVIGRRFAPTRWLAMTGMLFSLPVSFPHLRLDFRHAGDPAIIIFGLFAHVAQHLRMRQDDKRFLLDSLQGIVRDLLRRQIAVAGLRALRNRAEHVGVAALPTPDRNPAPKSLLRG